MNRRQIQLGFVLILLALLTGFGMPLFRNPRLGLTAHIVGITGGLVLIALGMLAKSFVLGARASAVMMGAWVYAAYANWVASLLGAFTGASRRTPIAGAGTSADALSEGAVEFLLISLSVAAIVGTALAIYGFRNRTSLLGSALCVLLGVHLDAQTLDDTIRQRLDAYARLDAAGWAKFVANDCVCGGSTKAAIQSELKSRPPSMRNWYGPIEKLRVHRYGNTAVAHYEINEHVALGDQTLAHGQNFVARKIR